MGDHSLSPPRRVSFIVFVLVVCVVTVISVSGCGSDKGTTPTQTLTGSWPAEATGRYERVIENKFCQNPLNCKWLHNWTDTVDVCGDPVVADWMRFGPPSAIDLSGVISDSIYDVTATITFNGECQTVWKYTTTDTGMPPSREGWQYLTWNLSTTCGMEPDPEPDPGKYRYTFTRIGDADCGGE